jgi:hypothetical protein
LTNSFSGSWDRYHNRRQITVSFFSS